MNQLRSSKWRWWGWDFCLGILSLYILFFGAVIWGDLNQWGAVSVCISLLLFAYVAVVVELWKVGKRWEESQSAKSRGAS